MSATCCGAERTTPFCPQCGKRLEEDSSLNGLVERCRQTEKGIRKEVENLRACPGKDNPQIVERRGRREARASQWKAWGDALAKLLEGAEGGGTP